MKMKPILLILALVLTNVLMAQNQKIKWYSFEEALALNKEKPEKDFLLIFIPIGVVGANEWIRPRSKMPRS